MKKIVVILILLAIGNVSNSQDIRFSYSVDLTNPANIVVDVFARTAGADETIIGYTFSFYYDGNEAAYTGYDVSTATALGWLAVGNFSESDLAASNGLVPSTHTMRIEVQQFDGNGAGTLISTVPVKVGTFTMDRTAMGDPGDGGDLYIGDSVTDGPAVVYFNSLGGTPPIVTEGTVQQSLPIVLRDFDVTKKGDDGASLNWVTSSEQNSSHFDVERSVNGKDWSKIGEVQAAGNSFTEHQYRFEDGNLKAIPNADNVFYYRLKAVDFDDQFDYSPVKNIKLDNGDLAVNIYPNPTSEGIWIRMSQQRSSKEELSYTMVDISGKIVQAGNLGNAAEINEYILLSKEIANGTYMLNINSDTQNISTERVIVIGKK